ncbi:MAG: hypothetical protein JSR17_11385 [Proteobacteria bacterium]|nr:hypothetical protein [Pseudomonadota bacterium]
MQRGPHNPNSKQKTKGQKIRSPQQRNLLQKCSQIFSNEGDINHVALDGLFTFLCKENLNELDFNDEIEDGLSKGASALSVLALAASSGFAKNLDKVISSVDVKKLNFNFKCPSSPSIFQGFPLLFLLMHACAYGYTRCLERVFSEMPLKNFNFKAKCNEGNFQGTDIFWMAALAASRGHPQYLDKILKQVPIRELDIDVVCQRPVRRVAGINLLSTQSNPIEALNILFSELVLSPDEIVEPFCGESTLHLLAQVAAQGKPEHLKSVLRKITLTPQLLNQKILEGPNKGATLFHLIAEAEVRSAKPQGILEEVPNKVLLQLDLNSVVEGGESEGTTALYWVAAAAGNGRPNCLERIISKKLLSELNLKVRGKGRDCRDLTILDWLTRTVWFGQPKALERLMAKKAFDLHDFKVKNGWGVSPLFLLAKGVGRGQFNIFEDVFFATSLDESDINSKYLNKDENETSLLWWLALCAIDGKAKYLEHLSTMVPIDKWDLEATCEIGANEGWSVLNLIAEAGIRGHSQLLARILSQLPADKLNLMKKISCGKSKGLTVFHQICQAANNGNPQYLDIVLERQDLLRSVDFNSRCEEGLHQGTTPLWWACAAAIKGSSAQLEKILEVVPLANLDFNATCTKGPYKGISAFQLVVRAAAHGNVKPLEVLFKRLKLNEIQFNTICKRGEFCGATTLWWICLLAASGHPEFLDKLLESVPINQLDFNLPCLEGINEGITPIWWVILATKNGKGNEKTLDLILQSVSITELIRNQVESKNNSILMLLAWCGYVDIIESYFNEISVTELDLNTRATSGQFKETSLLWWLAALAAAGYPTCFERVLREVPLDVLNFDVRSDQSGKSLKEILSKTRWSSYIELLSNLKRIKSMLKRQVNISSLLDGLDDVAARADVDGHFDTYYVLARFFQSCQNPELFKKYALKVPQEHSYSNEIILELHRIEQESKTTLTSNNENHHARLETRSEIDDLSSKLGKLLVSEAQNDAVIEAASTELTRPLDSSSTPLTFSNALSQLTPSSFAIESNPADAPRRVEWRSKKAKELHSLVMRACRSKDKRSFAQILEILDKCLGDCPMDALAERSINGFSHLDDVLHLPFENQSDLLFAEHVSKTLFIRLSTEMKARLPKERFCEVICNNTNKGFTLLHAALRSGCVTNTQMIIELCESSLDRISWQAILRSTNHFGYNGFQQAVSSGKLGLVKLFITAVEKAYGEDSEPLLKELGNEIWRIIESKSWMSSPEHKAIKTLIDPFVNLKASSQRLFC